MTEEASSNQEKQELLTDLGTMNLPEEIESPIHCLTIIGQIEGHIFLAQGNKATRYEHIIPQLVAIEQDPQIKGVLVILNTVGGDV